MAESDKPSGAITPGWIILGLLIAGLAFFGLLKALYWVGAVTAPYVSHLSFGSPDPKKAWWVITSDEVIPYIVMFWVLLVSTIVIRLRDAKSSKKEVEESNQKLQELEAAKAAIAQEIADLEAKRDVARNERLESIQLENMRRQIRSQVEEEWQRDRQGELEREHARYLSYVERQRIAKAEYEAAKQGRVQRLLELEKFVLAAFPDIAQRTDPAGTKGPEAVSAALRKHCLKKLDDPELLRMSQDQDVRAKLGSLSDFPPAPPPISPPILVPIPENLRRRFEGEEVHNMVGITSC